MMLSRYDYDIYPIYVRTCTCIVCMYLSPYTSYLVDRRSHQPKQMITIVILCTYSFSGIAPTVDLQVIFTFQKHAIVQSPKQSTPTSTRPCSLAQLATTLLLMFLPCILTMCLQLHNSTLHSTRRSMIAVMTFVCIVAIHTSSDESKFVMPQLYHAFVKPWDSTKVVISCIYADRS